jgi:eukaryotic-like serine/threonine-protein kinase
VSSVNRGLQEWLKTQDAGLRPPTGSNPGEGGEAPPAAPPTGAGPPATPPDPASALFARYEYLGDIGAGGVGSVHCVRDRVLLRQVALKVLDPVLAERPVQVQRFTHEAQVNAQLEHPNIVPVHELVLSPDGPKYFTMKLVEGMTLDDWIISAGRPQGSLEVLHEMLSAFLKVCDALAFAHSRGALHCDLKPGNIMVGAFGEVYLMDWGLARPHHGPSETAPLRSSPDAAGAGVADESRGRVLGTPAYMSPEQANGLDDHFGEHTDVFGLGAVLYSILTGDSPHRGPTTSEALAQARAGEIAFPEHAATQVPPALWRIARRALARKPEDRYPTVLALKRDVDAFLRGGFQFPVRSYPPGAAIVREGELGDEAFLIEKGSCVVYKTVNGEAKLLRRLAIGSVFGETAALAGGVRTATVEAVDEVSVRVVTRKLLEENLGLSSWFGAFVVALAGRFREVDQQLADSLPPRRSK